MIIHNLGIKDYTEIWEQMKEFTAIRDSNSYDELWLLEHYPVYTQGQAGKPEHVLNPNSIKIVQSDRGGQVTYHGYRTTSSLCFNGYSPQKPGHKNFSSKTGRNINFGFRTL